MHPHLSNTWNQGIYIKRAQQTREKIVNRENKNRSRKRWRLLAWNHGSRKAKQNERRSDLSSFSCFCTGSLFTLAYLATRLQICWATQNGIRFMILFDAYLMQTPETSVEQKFAHLWDLEHRWPRSQIRTIVSKVGENLESKRITKCIALLLQFVNRRLQS